MFNRPRPDQKAWYRMVGPTGKKDELIVWHTTVGQWLSSHGYNVHRISGHGNNRYTIWYR